MQRSTTLVSLLLIFGLLMGSTAIYGQKYKDNYEVKFRKGERTFQANSSMLTAASQIGEHEKFADRIYRFIQFWNIPTEAERKKIEAAGIQLFDYIPHKTYVASIPKSFDFSAWDALGIRSIAEITVSDKIDQRLGERPFPSWVKAGNQVRLVLRYYKDIAPQTVKAELESLDLKILETEDYSNWLIVQIPPSQIEKLAKLSFVRYLDFEAQPGKAESDEGRNLHRSNTIDAGYAAGKHYDGTGVSVAINDDGYAGPHIDFTGRSDQTDVATDFTGTHGDMTVGIVGAAGNLDPIMRGMAPGAFLWVRQYNSNLPNTISLHQNDNVLIFSSSYSDGCNAGYTNVTETVDQQIYQNPNLIQVFSAGNSNNQDCGYGAGNQWGNITGGHKMGKNVIATANLEEDDDIAPSSSRGPASDGRIKPDIGAHGNYQMSTAPDNTYAAGSGTSAAAPGIAGCLAQLHHAYSDMNGGAIAPSALLKASVLNTANDLGTPGPDFIFGWGKINAYKAMKTIEDNRYLSSSISQAANNNHQITVPAGVEQLRVMVYWHDYEGSVSASYALVNDLDLTVTDPSTTTHLPLVLNHAPNVSTLDDAAVPGVDGLNNMEQVRIDNPAAGTYNIDIAGSVVPQGPQTYYVVYEYLMDDIMVTFPLGGEGLVPGDAERVHWDAGTTSGTFTVEYTIDNGSNWVNIASNVAGTARFTDWTVPNNVTGQARVRVSRGAVMDESDANFSIIETPANIAITAACSGSNTVRLVWDSVANATSYDVYLLGAMYMDSVGTTSAFTFDVPVANILDENWFSVSANGINNADGRRAIAISSAGFVGGATCLLDCVSDEDAGVRTINSPLPNQESCGGSNSFDVDITLENIGPNTQSGFPVFYQLDNGPIISETFAGSLNGGGTAQHVFATQINLPSPATYTLKVWTELTNDGATCNDTTIMTINFNDPIAVYPYDEDFQSGTFAPNLMVLENPDGDDTWEENNTTGSDGNATVAAFVDNFAYDAAGEEDLLTIVSFDLSSGAAAANLKFDVAYARYSATFFDGLRVDLSTDCGQNYSQIYFKEGTNLATVGDQTSSWEPTGATDWREENIDLTPYVGGTAKIRFVNINGYGNGLFLDNINVETINAAPSADFQASTAISCNGSVDFTDLSTGTPQQWDWDFGDNGTSTDQNPSYTYTTEGTFTVTLIASNAVGSDTFVQTAVVTVDFPDDPVPSVTSVDICEGQTASLSAVGNNTVRWLDANDDVLATGTNYTTPVLSSTTVYQVENAVTFPSQNVGPVDGSIGGGGYHGTGFTGTINFTASKAVTIVSAWVDAEEAGDRDFFLWDDIDGGGNILQQITVNIPAGQGRINLGFDIPAAGTYSIGASLDDAPGNNTSLYRNNSGTNYPYSIAGLITLFSSSATSPLDFYYYLYDLEVQEAPCRSNPVNVTVNVANPDFSFVQTGLTFNFTDISTGASTWLWDFGDNSTSTDQDPNHTFQSEGTYTVTLTIDGGCSSTQTIVVTSVGKLEKDLAISLVPNPTSAETTLRLSDLLGEDLNIRITDLNGRNLEQLVLPAGSDNISLDLSNFSPAMYFIHLQTDSFSEVLKVVVRK